MRGRLLLLVSSFNQTITLPHLDGSTITAPTISRPLSITLPLIDGGGIFAPAVTSTATPAASDGLTVKTYSRAGSLLATLDESKARSFLDQIDDTGTFRLNVQNDDADLTHTGFDRIVRYEIAGQARFSGVIEARNVVTHAQGEDPDEFTTLSGRGALALLGEARVYPSRGVGSLPIEEVRSFSWSAVDFDYSTWPNAKALCRQDVETSGWDSTNPEAWPTPAAMRIWGDVDTASTVHAPSGTCLFRDTLTVATAGPHAFFAAWDNIGELYVDGAKVMVGSPDYVKARKIVIELSAGTHYIASIAENGEDNGAAGDNPAYFLASCHPVDRQGLLDAAIWSTSATTKCVPYVTGLPGFTPGKVIRLLLEEAQADDKLTDWSLGFTDTLDSNGEPWDLSAEITAGVGRSSYLDVLREMAASIIDVAAAAGNLVLLAYRFGTRGSAKSVNLRNTTTKATSQLTSLSHDGRRVGFNALLIRYAGGYTEVTDSTSITANGRRDDYLELGWVQSETEAQRIGTEHMAVYKDARYSTSAGIDPSSDATAPYASFEVGDSPNVTNQDGDLTAMRCRSIAVDEDEHGLIGYGGEFNSISLEKETRWENWLRRMAAGSLAGGSKVASPAGTASMSDESLVSVRVGEFSYEGTVANGTAVSLLLNGTVIATLTFDATEEDEQTVHLDLRKVHGDTDHLQVRVGSEVSDRSMRRPAEASGNLLTFAVTRTLEADGTAGLVAQARGI